MKNIMKISLLLVLILSMLTVGCGEKEVSQEEAETSESSSEAQEDEVIEEEKVEEPDKEDKSDSDDVDDMLKAAADKEGISVKELQKTLDGLAELGGEKFGITKEEYIEQVEGSGSSVLEEWTLASEVMGMSITELYEAEKASMANRTDEEKEVLAGMADALSEIGDLDVSVDQLEGEQDINALMGITENTTGEIVEVNGEFTKDFYYKADDVDFEYEDEYSLSVEYYSNEATDKILEYYVGFLGQTENYILIVPTGTSDGMIQGYYNGMDVYVEIMDNGDGRTYVACYLDYTSKN